MRLSYLTRPLFLSLLSYLGLIILADQWGFFVRQAENGPGLAATGAVVEAVGSLRAPVVLRPSRSRAILEISQIDARPVVGRILMVWSGPAWNFEPGDVLRVQGKWYLPPRARFQGGFDYRGYLARQNIFSILSVQNAQLEKKGGFSVSRWAYRLRSSIQSVYEREFSPSQQGILGGIVLGEKSLLPRELNRAFRDAGAMHLLVASGSNVAFVWLLVFSLGGIAGMGERAKLFLGAFFAGVYTCVAGADAPLLRAYLMALAVAAGHLLERDSGLFQALVLSAWLILIYSPQSLFMAGFQLSYVAVLGLIWAIPRWQPFFSRWAKGPGRDLKTIFIGIGAASVVCQLVLTPILANTFHQISIIATMSNLILVPLAASLMGLGLAVYACWWLPVPWLFEAAAWASRLSLTAFEGLVAFFAGLPFSSVSVGSLSGSQIFAYYLGAFGILALPSWKTFFRLGAGGAVLALLLGSQRFIFGPGLEILELGGIGARSVLCRARQGQTWLVDAGMSGTELVRQLRQHGVGRLNGVFLTSCRKDSWRGLQRLAEDIAIESVYAPADIAVDPSYLRMRKSLARHGAAWVEAWPGWSQPAGPIEWSMESFSGFTGHPELDDAVWKLKRGSADINFSAHEFDKIAQ
ncbi:MAG: ComEC/Rec2 family competence protein [Elusimicrobia bacterium]|nr:ComEC/Rec2 family competence protein [Elusimicrobiota bacterium]